MQPVPENPRAECYRCMRPQAQCLCADVVPVATATRVVVLQHPRESRHPFGTARLLRLWMPQARIEVAHGGFDEVLRHEVEVPEDAAVLYPHPEAVDLAELPHAQMPSTLVLLDGTWAHARRLYKDNPWIQRLRHVRIAPPRPSNYRIRKEPQADFVSTVEALVYALSILEPDNREPRRLIAAFDSMIDRQIELLDVVQRRGRPKKQRNREPKSLSPLLSREDLVVVYAETFLPDGDAARPRDLAQWTAVRLSDGAVFDAVIRPEGPWPTDPHLDHMGLGRDMVEQGLSLAQARAAFDAFAGPGAPVAAWTKTTLDWSHGVLDPGRGRVVLKIDYSNLRNRRASYCESMMAREGIAERPVAVRGRAGLRLGNAMLVARWLADRRADLHASVGAPPAPASGGPDPG